MILIQQPVIVLKVINLCAWVLIWYSLAKKIVKGYKAEVKKHRERLKRLEG